MLELVPAFDLTAEMLPMIREGMGAMEPEPPREGVAIEELRTEGPLDVALRVFQPITDGESKRGCILWIHGGGFLIGNRSMDDPLLNTWVHELGCVVVSVEYRLAPEHPYPAPLEDCYEALSWVIEHKGELNVDPSRIGIGGLSAGGGLAAALAILNRDRDEHFVAFQLLECPMLDHRQITPSSQADWLAIWSRSSNAFGWASYLGELSGSGEIPGTASPARCEDLSGLPPALIKVGSIDGFHDEDVAYATRLNQAGVPAELHVYPGVPHGMTVDTTTSVGQQATRDALEFLRRQFATEAGSA